MKTRWLGLLLLLALPLGAFAAGKTYPEQRIVVFAQSTTPQQRVAILNQLGARVVRELPLVNAVVIRVPTGESFVSVEQTLSVLPMVVRVENDAHRDWLLDDDYYAPLPTDSQLLERLQNQTRADALVPTKKKPHPGKKKDEAVIPWGISRVNAPAAWAVTKGGGVGVAVVDTGIDLSHPDLAANIAGGYNVLVTTQPPQDDNGHGTHVSGTIAGAGIPGGVLGVAPKASLYAVKVLDADGEGYISDIIAGIQWVVAQNGKIKVINMSLGGGGDDQSFHDAIKAAVSAGVTVVCAAGNSYAPANGSASSVDYPAKYPESIAVAALQQGSDGSPETIADFSSRGPEVAFIAPGVNVYSSYLGGGYQNDDGTSMASPHVAGLAVLAIAAGASSPSQVRAALTAAATPVAGLGSSDEGAGVPDAARIVGAALAMGEEGAR